MYVSFSYILGTVMASLLDHIGLNFCFREVIFCVLEQLIVLMKFSSIFFVVVDGCEDVMATNLFHFC